MTYRIAKLVSDYVSPGIFVNRLELGDSGFSGPVDLRFIGEPGWIENAHSLFLGVDGRDAYYPTNTGGLITMSDTGDLVFFDPSNDVGRTLTQLYGGGGGGLWEDDLAYVRLTTARALDIGEQNIDNVGERIQFDTSQIYSKIQFHGTADALIYSHVEAPDPIVDRWDFFIDDVSRLAVGVDGIDAWEPLDMNDNKITGLGVGAAAGDAVQYEQVLLLAGGQMNSEADIDMNFGSLSQVGGISGMYSPGFTLDWIFSGSNLAGDGVNEFMRWHASEQELLVRKPIVGTVSDTLDLKFRGGDTHRIRYDSVSAYLMYEALAAHQFSVASVAKVWIHPNGLSLAASTSSVPMYIGAVSGDLEFRVASGSSIKFTAV